MIAWPLPLPLATCEGTGASPSSSTSSASISRLIAKADPVWRWHAWQWQQLTMIGSAFRR